MQFIFLHCLKIVEKKRYHAKKQRKFMAQIIVYTLRLCTVVTLREIKGKWKYAVKVIVEYEYSEINFSKKSMC